ncbi:hypothetical protein CCACVL1_08487 [Corchorus capsularis]|uniref:Uncharacterized protein n=1 Tax=Corchorus capsularis TaxID=210143 RepID=A0A1R3J0G0_COCAP|nr:hypothetical protein CCACVL1_08487 [Corchorus capsularis]
MVTDRTELLDDNFLLLSRKECRVLHSKIDKERGLTSDYATLNKAKDDDDDTFEVFKMQVQKEIEDLKVAKCEEKDTELATVVADASDIAKELVDEARADLLKLIKEAHPGLDLSAFEVAVVGGEKGTPSQAYVEEDEAVVSDKGIEVMELLVHHIVIPSLKQAFTTDELFDVSQGDIAHCKEIGDQFFAEEADTAILPTAAVDQPVVPFQVQGDAQDKPQDEEDAS